MFDRLVRTTRTTHVHDFGLDFNRPSEPYCVQVEYYYNFQCPRVDPVALRRLWRWESRANLIVISTQRVGAELCLWLTRHDVLVVWTTSIWLPVRCHKHNQLRAVGLIEEPEYGRFIFLDQGAPEQVELHLSEQAIKVPKYCFRKHSQSREDTTFYVALEGCC